MLAGEYGSAYTQGLQQYTGDEEVVQSVVTLKHFLAYSIESYHGVTRQMVDVKVSAYDMSATYTPAWEATIKKGKALGVMCSYNAVNGLPTCGNPALNATLRDDWGFLGYMTSDSDSCACIIKGHPQGHGGPPRPTNGTDATKQCLMGGTDIDSGGTYRSYLAAAIRDGELEETVARLALKNSYKMRGWLGLFDPLVPNKYKKITTDEVGSAEHQAASLLAAQKSMVLLKKGVLPFTPGKRVAVIGQSVNDTNSMTGNYDGPLCPGGGASCFMSIGQAVQGLNVGGETEVLVSTDSGRAAGLAAGADYVILVVDNFHDGGGEGHDRETIGLSTAQVSLAEAVISANPQTALVLVNGGMISLDHLKDLAPAILDAFMPGVHGGTAIAQTVFGLNNPGGKLPVSMYHSSYVNFSDFLNMSMVNRTYRYYTGEPLYQFGYGESYTSFELSWGLPPPAATATVSRVDDSQMVYRVAVTNTGPVEGDEVVMCFLQPDEDSFDSLGPESAVEIRRLVGFERVTLKPGASADLGFAVSPQQLGMVDSDGHTSLHAGRFKLVFTRGHGEELAADVRVQPEGGRPMRIKTLRKWW
eukprot:TRINITY_DN16320_c0_g1_i2.p1 TRINITY_DN16320_c0_g1~~TRINITY_DN16320_c0_g1_i2.p1  ORF type:complete len:586 (+),score=136.91 TRINITY_DN16320_c0_g1_i2:194-1951(+)